jgi:hypothetical protein
MAMDVDAMANLIDGYMPPLAEDDARAARLEGLKAIARGVIEHIQGFASVAVPGTGLVAPGGGGPVTGAGIGTIT